LVPIIWGIEAFLLIISGWWGFLELNNSIVLENAGPLFLLSLLLLVLFLIASLSLPHKVNKPLRLWDYFNAHKILFYFCHMAYFLLIPIVLGSFADEVNIIQTLNLLGLTFVLFCLMWLKQRVGIWQLACFLWWHYWGQFLVNRYNCSD
jgi:hypothetical protein